GGPGARRPVPARGARTSLIPRPGNEKGSLPYSTRRLQMARTLLCLAALSLACATPAPQPDKVAAQAAPATAGVPPIIDRELLFGDPEISGAQLSPDGNWISFMKPLDGTRNIWVKRREEPFDKARPISADTKRPIPGHFWSRDSKFVLFVQDQAGDENFNVFAVDPS